MLLNQGSHGCVYYPGIQCTNEKNMVSKVVNIKHATHELAICDIIKKIPQYKRYFIPIETSCVVKSKKVKPCKVLSNAKTFMVMNMPFFKSLPEEVELDHYMELLNSIELLIQYKLVHFDIKYENIIFKPRPFLIDFGISLNMQDINIEYFYFYQPSYFMWPIDVHLLGYINNVGKLDAYTLTRVCKEVYNKSPYLKNVDECIHYYTYLVSYKKDEMIQELLKGWNTWDLYSATVMLFKNIHVEALLPIFDCNPSKRLTPKASRLASRLASSSESSCVS
jgi:serine/threonine protein kinase